MFYKRIDSIIEVCYTCSILLQHESKKFELWIPNLKKITVNLLRIM